MLVSTLLTTTADGLYASPRPLLTEDFGPFYLLMLPIHDPPAQSRHEL